MYTVKRMPEFDAWFDSIKDGMTRIRLAKRLDKAQRGLLGDVESVGGGVRNARVFWPRLANVLRGAERKFDCATWRG